MADKITLNTLASIQNDPTAVALINANSATIVAGMDNTLSRDGTAPNQMQSDLDMNGFAILNSGGVLPPTTGVSWTPTLTFSTPGDLSVGYTVRLGKYWQLSSNIILVYFNIQTSSFTFTTASGNVQITGFPLIAKNTASLNPRGTTTFAGINKTNYTAMSSALSPNTSIFQLAASGMGVAASAVTATDMPTGGTVQVTAESIIFL